ncbi:MAG: flagellar basal body-associated FliL family protein [Silicimonas sp.]|nr:flagellar basal body-associated FliL family protein [Silicimonas sp.]
MAEEDQSDEGAEAPKKKGGLLIGLVLAVIGGGGAFAYTSGMLGGGDEAAKPVEKELSADLAFIPMEPMTVSIGGPSARRHLRFRAELEVDSAGQSDVENLLPRVVDVLNTYLQSLSIAEIEDPAALLTLRSQMRRRIDLVVGGDRVHDLLVMEFVLN